MKPFESTRRRLLAAAALATVSGCSGSAEPEATGTTTPGAPNPTPRPPAQTPPPPPGTVPPTSGPNPAPGPSPAPTPSPTPTPTPTPPPPSSPNPPPGITANPPPVPVPPVPTASASSPPAGAPSWRRNLRTLQWFELPNTRLDANLNRAPYIAAGLLGPDGRGIGLGAPWLMTNFSGAAFRQSGAWMLLFGGGGAGAWAGNDVVGLRFNHESPYLETLVAPTNASQVWTKGVGPGRPYMRDGVSPNARHSYMVHQFSDALDRGFTLGGANEWETDSATWGNVDGYTWSERVWRKDVAQTITTNAYRGLGDDVPVVKHPLTEDFYRGRAEGFVRFARADNYATWSPINRDGPEVWGSAAIHPTLDLMVMVGREPSSGAGGYFTTMPLSGVGAGRTVRGQLVGGAAGRVSSSGHGFCWVPDWNAFAFFCDDGNLYRIFVSSRSQLTIDLVQTSELGGGHRPPANGGSSNRGDAGAQGIWTRLQYSSELRGLCLVQSGSHNARFIATA